MGHPRLTRPILVSIQSEVNLHIDRHRYRLAVLSCRIKLPPTNRVNCTLIEPMTYQFLYLNLLRRALRIDDKPKHNGAFNAFPFSGFWVFGVRRFDSARGRNPIATPVNHFAGQCAQRSWFPRRTRLFRTLILSGRSCGLFGTLLRPELKATSRGQNKNQYSH
jgi:hypothetical protein